MGQLNAHQVLVVSILIKPLYESALIVICFFCERYYFMILNERMILLLHLFNSVIKSMPAGLVLAKDF